MKNVDINPRMISIHIKAIHGISNHCELMINPTKASKLANIIPTHNNISNHNVEYLAINLILLLFFIHFDVFLRKKIYSYWFK